MATTKKPTGSTSTKTQPKAAPSAEPAARTAPAAGPAHRVQSEPSESREERVARRAYELYLERGGQHGRDQDDWLRAEQELADPGHASHH